VASASAQALPPGRRSAFRLRGARLAPPLLTTAAMLALAELLSRSGALPRDSFPPATEVLRALADEARTARFWQAVRETLQGWALGLGIAAAWAIPAGVLLGSVWYAYRAARGIVEFLRPIPSVALVPLAVLVYGTGTDSKVFLAAYAASWPLLIQTLYGVHDVDAVALETARAYRVARRTRFLRVTLPSAAPYVATGLRLASTTALILAVTAELVIGSPGLGSQIALAEASGATTPMYALIAATGLLGLLLNGVFARAERRVLRWHASQRREAAA
jgi:ABC-type nitrate/sulfonate/bicarbonate transport system permease component